MDLPTRLITLAANSTLAQRFVELPMLARAGVALCLLACHTSSGQTVAPRMISSHAITT